jgi:hypothetical protein
MRIKEINGEKIVKIMKILGNTMVPETLPKMRNQIITDTIGRTIAIGRKNFTSLLIFSTTNDLNSSIIGRVYFIERLYIISANTVINRKRLCLSRDSMYNSMLKFQQKGLECLHPGLE